MKTMFNARAKPLFAVAVAAVLGLAGSQQASAQSVQFQGMVQGCFGDGCVVADVAALNGPDGLVFVGDDFDVNAIWVNSLSRYQRSVGDGTFGLFVLGSAVADYESSFTLQYTFTLPSANNSVFTASLDGTVTTTDGTVTIAYAEPRSNVWYDGNWAYSVAVHDFTGVDYNSIGLIDATVTAVVPEPITLGLMATGLLGLGGVAGRRRRKLYKADLI